VKAAILALPLLLAACATAPPEPRVEFKEVQVPVPVRCAPQLGARPDYPDTDDKLRAAPSADARYHAMATARPLHYAREEELEGALKGCTGG
jgi:hypothetical protein